MIVNQSSRRHRHPRRRRRHCRRLPCAQSLWPTRTANWQLRLHVVST